MSYAFDHRYKTDSIFYKDIEGEKTQKLKYQHDIVK